MADATTVYDILARYKMQDGGMAGRVRRISKEVGILTRTWRAARSQLRGFTDAFYAFNTAQRGLGFVGRHLVGFNATLEQARITMAGMLRLNVGGQFSDHMGTANRLVGEFQQIAKKSVGTTMDFVQMAQRITRPIAAAGLSMTDLRDITKGAVIASRAFGIQAEVAALDIEQAMMGMLTKRERFARALLEPMGLTTEAFNKLNAQQRAQMLKLALTQPAIDEMAGAQEKSFSGVMSTFQDNLQMALGRIGLPLFQRLTKEVQSWNTWIDANSARLEAMGARLGDALAHGFGIVKDAVSFIVENRDIFLSLAKTFLAFKVGQIGVGFAKGIASNIRGFVGTLKKAEQAVTGFRTGLPSTTSRLMTFASGLGAVIPALFAFAPAIDLVRDALDGMSADEKRRAKATREVVAHGKITAKQGAQIAKDQTTIRSLGQKQRLSALEQVRLSRARGRIAEGAGGFQEAERKLLQMAMEEGFIVSSRMRSRAPTGLMAGGEELSKRMSQAGIADPREVMNAIDQALMRFGTTGELAKFIAGEKKQEEEPERPKRDYDEEVKTLLKRAAGVTNVTVHRIEVAAADPNRFVHDMTAAFERFNRAPTQARDALRGGF